MARQATPNRHPDACTTSGRTRHDISKSSPLTWYSCYSANKAVDPACRLDARRYHRDPHEAALPFQVQSSGLRSDYCVCVSIMWGCRHYDTDMSCTTLIQPCGCARADRAVNGIADCLANHHAHHRRRSQIIRNVRHNVECAQASRRCNSASSRTTPRVPRTQSYNTSETLLAQAITKLVLVLTALFLFDENKLHRPRFSEFQKCCLKSVNASHFYVSSYGHPASPYSDPDHTVVHLLIWQSALPYKSKDFCVLAIEAQRTIMSVDCTSALCCSG